MSYLTRLGLLVFFLILIIHSAGIETLVCQRVNFQRVTCSLKQSKYYNSVEELKGVYPNVLRASVTVYETYDGGNVDYTYVTTLLTSSGNEKLKNPSSDTAIKINSFLDNPTRNVLTITYDERHESWLGFLFSVIVVDLCCQLIMLALKSPNNQKKE